MRSAPVYAHEDVFNMPDVEFVSLEEAGLEYFDLDTVPGALVEYFDDEDRTCILMH